VHRKLTRARLVRYGVFAASACLAIGALAAVLPGAYAGSSTTSGQLPLLPYVNGSPRGAAFMHRKQPPYIVRATHPLPRTGKQGPAFQPLSSVSGIAPRIYHGFMPNPADYPWIVGIETQFWIPDAQGNLERWTEYCTGTVISPTKVLTAGHCATDVPFNDVPFGTTVVIAGRAVLDQDTGGQVVLVASDWINQSYHMNISGQNEIPIDDVAVLSLETPLASTYTPISLTAQGDQTPYKAMTSAQIVGYGITATQQEDVGVLRTATVDIQDDATCTAAYGSLYDGTRMTCAGDPPSGSDTCEGDSGGPLVVNGVEVGITDWGQNPCGSNFGVYERLSTYSDLVKADLNRKPPVNLDWSGDGHSDLLARDSAGNLYEYSGTGFGHDPNSAFDAAMKINTGWGGFSKLFRVTDWMGTGGLESVMAETPNGDLYLYPEGLGGPPDSYFQPRILIGNGWNAFVDIMVTNNWTGDGHPNLMGRTKNGDLVMYTGDGHGGWENPNGTLIGTGWNGFNTVTTPGDWYGNGHQSLIGRTPHGELVIYNSDGAGGWTNPNGTLIGTGWNGFRLFMSPGDFNGDDTVDVIGVTPGGNMYLYTTDGHGNWLTGIGQPIGAGWQYLNQIF
jgi:trypsin